MLNIYDISKSQAGKLFFESINDLGPAQSVVKFVEVSQIHNLMLIGVACLYIQIEQGSEESR